MRRHQRRACVVANHHAAQAAQPNLQTTIQSHMQPCSPKHQKRAPTCAVSAVAAAAEEEVQRPRPQRVRGHQRSARVVRESHAVRAERDGDAAAAEVHARATGRGAGGLVPGSQLLAAAGEAQPQRARLT